RAAWDSSTEPQRVRLGVMAGGKLGVAWVAKGGRATTETALGQPVWARQLQGRDWAHQRLVWAGGKPLARSDRDLLVGDEVAVSGSAWEAYAGIEGVTLS